MADDGGVDDVVSRARSGDRTALGELWRAHQHLLLRYFRGRSTADPEDLASQVWIDVASGLHRFEGDLDDFPRWLFTIAHRRAVDAVRRSARRRETPVGTDGLDEAIDERAAEALEAGDDLDRALARIRTLPPDQAEAVLLRVVADLDVAEVAAIMGKREGHVRVLTHRGLERLRAQDLDKPVTRAVPPTMYRLT
jgi:RNA polymerase sigma-70 factor, ECF subfamily